MAKGRFRGRPLARRASRTPFESQRHTGSGSACASEVATAEPGPRKQPFACVPHADGFVGLLDVPGLRACASLPVRADCRPDIHSCRPLPSPASATSALKDRLRPLKTSAARRHCGPPRPVPRREDDRCALRIGTGRGQNIPSRMKVNSFRN